MKDKILNHFSGNFRPFYEKYLPEIKKSGKSESVALCPFHEETTPSFTFSSQNGMYYCFGCNQKGDIFHFHAKRNALDIQRDFPKILKVIADDFSIPFSNTNSKSVKSKSAKNLKPFQHYQLGFPVQKYPYKDAKDKILYYSCRFEPTPNEPKPFRQCSSSGLNWKVKNIKPKVPYNLPKVIDAETVYIVEGEKDCHSLEKLNLVGTCNVAGAGSWTPDLNHHFKGKEIILVPDNDDPGRRHVQKVYAELKEVAADIKLVELPGLSDGGDFTDWLNTFDDMETAGESLAVMVENAGPCDPKKNEEPPSFEFIHNKELIANLKPMVWQITDIIPENSFYYDFGESGSYKTFVALDRLLCVAAGIDYHGHKVRQGTVFYIAGEGQQGIGRRIAVWHIAHGTNAEDIPFFMAKTPTQLMDPKAVDDVRKAVDYMSKEYGDPAIVHIDTLARNFGEGDENSTKDMNRVISNLDEAFGNDFCRGLTHHTGHFNKERARGSGVLHGASDVAFRVSIPLNQQVLVECTKMKDAASSPAMLFELERIRLLIDNQYDPSFVLDLVAEGDEALKTTGNKIQKVEAVVTALIAMGGKVESQAPLNNAVRVELNCCEKTARGAIKQAVKMKKITAVQRAGKGNPVEYKLPE